MISRWFKCNEENICDLRSELERSIDDNRGELDELANRVSFIEDDSIDNIRSDIDLLKDDVRQLKTDVNGIKDNPTYLENEVIQSLRDEVSEHYDEFIQLQNGVQQLQQKV
jgi:uncharacterized coiled-coil DUF342 family protein